MKDSGIKEKILDVASRLFYEQGYNLTGINQIIEEADIARGSLYNHFKSKEELLMEYLRMAEIRWFANLDAYLRVIKDPRKKILALFDHRIGMQLQSGFAGCRFIKLGIEVSRDQTEVFPVVAEQKRRFRNIIQELVEAIEVKAPMTKDALTETIFLMIEGAGVIGSLQKDDMHYREAKKIIATLL